MELADKQHNLVNEIKSAGENYNVCHDVPATPVRKNSPVIPGKTLYRCPICHVTWYGPPQDDGLIPIGQNIMEGVE